MINLFEALVNQAISLSPTGHKPISQLVNKQLCFEVTDLNITWYCQFHTTGVHLNTTSFDDIVDTSISAPLQAWLTFAITKNIRKAQQAGLIFTGDTEVGQALQQLSIELDIDWEEGLSKLTGDVFARQVSHLFQQAKSTTQSTMADLTEMMTDYLQEETNMLPTVNEGNEFMHEVDQLRLATDRVEARLNLLLEASQDEIS